MLLQSTLNFVFGFLVHDGKLRLIQWERIFFVKVSYIYSIATSCYWFVILCSLFSLWKITINIPIMWSKMTNERYHRRICCTRLQWPPSNAGNIEKTQLNKFRLQSVVFLTSFRFSFFNSSSSGLFDHHHHHTSDTSSAAKANALTSVYKINILFFFKKK